MHPDNFVGIHLILASLPLWATVIILWSITDGIMHFGRDRLEGIGYQIAFSAKYGDVGLFGAVFIAATILQRGTIILPGWMMNSNQQLSLFVILVFVGAVGSFLTMKSRSGEIMDVYHDFIIAPMILFFAIMLLPVIYLGGTAVEKFWTVCFIFIWVICVAIDVKCDRMNQRRWMERHLGLVLSSSYY